MKTPGERLASVRKKASYRSARDAAIANGWKESTYRSHEAAGRGYSHSRDFGEEDAKKYARRFKTDYLWLLYGDEAKRGRHVESDEIALGLTPDYEGLATDQAYRSKLPGAAPEVDAHAGAGQGRSGRETVVAIGKGQTVTGIGVVAEWVLPPDYIRHELRASPSRILLLPVIGDSMRPTLSPGDRVVVDYEHTFPVPDGIYVIDEGYGPLVKRIELVRQSDPAQIRIISDNPSHSVQTVPADSIRIIGRVAAKIARM